MHPRRNLCVVGFWEAAVPLGSVLITGVVTGTVTIWSKRIDAQAKREDRQHARALDYEGRVWQAKNEALRRLIAACREVKSWAELYQSQPDPADVEYNTVLLAQAMRAFEDGIGGEEGVSEITAYTAEPVRTAVDAMLARFEKDLAPVIVPLITAGNCEGQIKRLEQQPQYKLGNTEPGKVQLVRKRAAYEERMKQAFAEVGAGASFDAAKIIELCEGAIDVARQDIQGRY